MWARSRLVDQRLCRSEGRPNSGGSIDASYSNLLRRQGLRNRRRKCGESIAIMLPWRVSLDALNRATGPHSPIVHLCWAARTNFTAEPLKNKFLRFMDDGDRITVVGPHAQ